MARSYGRTIQTARHGQRQVSSWRPTSTPRRTTVKIPTERVVPKGIVNTSKANSSTAEVERSNIENSPLLKLPSELRNRIWNLVFDVGRLHISCRSYNGKHKFPKMICVAEQHEAEAAQTIRESQVYNPSNLFSQRHLACINSTNWKAFAQILDVVKVSRQVHAEAALLPYQLNTFYFDSYKAFARFRDGLGTDHRRAVRSIGFDIERNSLHDPNPTLLHDMHGIKDLSIFLTSHRRHLMLQAHRSQGSTDLGISALKQLLRADLDLESVSVIIYPPPLFQTFGIPANVNAPNPLAPPNELDIMKDWVIHMEQKLLALSKGKAERTKRRTRSGKGFAGGETKKQKMG